VLTHNGNAPAVHRTVAEAIAARLRDEIRSGELPAGARLRLVELGERFGVSTTPVRDALAMLAREGLVVGQPQRGFEVFRPTVEDLEENYEMRIALESLATRRAATRLTGEDLAELRRLLDAMGRLDLDAADEYIALNAEFHGRIYAAAGRPRLTALIQDLRAATTAYLTIFATHQPSAADTQQEHEAILAALEARDPDRAADAMAAHLHHTVDVGRRSLAADTAKG